MKRILMSALVVMLVVALFVGCQQAPATPSASTPVQASEPVVTPDASAPVDVETPDVAESTPPVAPVSAKIGASIYTLKYEFFQGMQKGIEEKCAEYGFELLPVHDELEDPVEMVNGAKGLIDQGINTLIISPFKPDAMTEIVTYAHDAGVKVVICDIGTGGSDYDAFIVSDCKGGGAMAAANAAEVLADSTSKEVAVIKCEKTAVYANRRGEGFQEAIEALGFKVVNTQTADSNQDLGYAKMKDIMTANPDVVAVFCENDPMAVGAAQAIQEAKKDIKVFGFNADGIAIDAIKADQMVGTVAQFPDKMGAAAVDAAKAFAEGAEPAFSAAETKEIFAEVVLVTKDNVDTFNQ